MPADYLTHHTELYFRTHIHTVFPLHAALVEAMCKAPRVPLELATVLEDIGQGYCRLADEVNAELKRRNELGDEPDYEDTAEARIDEFVSGVFAGLAPLVFFDGQVVHARNAIEAYPIAADALRTALVLAKAVQPLPAVSPQKKHRTGKGVSGGMLRRSVDR